MFIIDHKNTIISVILVSFTLLIVYALLTIKVNIKFQDIEFDNNITSENGKDVVPTLVAPSNYKQYNDSAYICNDDVCCHSGFCKHLNGIVNDTYFPAFYNL